MTAKADRENDLSHEFVLEQFEKSCTYCGATQDEIRLTLDRVDNSLGHLKTNVVPACRRCNFIRRDMPFEAWLVVAKGMRKAREKGLFGDWKGRSLKWGEKGEASR